MQDINLSKDDLLNALKSRGRSSRGELGGNRGELLLLSSVYRTRANEGSDGVNCSKIHGTFASSKIFEKSRLYKKKEEGRKLPLKWPLPGGYAFAKGCNQNF